MRSALLNDTDEADRNIRRHINTVGKFSRNETFVQLAKTEKFRTDAFVVAFSKTFKDTTSHRARDAISRREHLLCSLMITPRAKT